MNAVAEMAAGKAGAPIDVNRTWAMSRGELERRWALVRQLLRDKGLQALIVQGYEEKIGGNVRWLTDIPPGYPRYVVVHLDDHMTLVDHGPHGEVRRLDDQDPNRPGIGELVTNWALFGANYTHGQAAESVAGVLDRRGYTKVGIVGVGALPYAFVTGLSELTGGRVSLTDVTDSFDALKASKSPEEIELLRGTAAAQDRVFDKLLKWLEPGYRDLEINAFIDYQMQLEGADRGVYIGVSAPIGKPAFFGYRSVQGRTMRAGDHMNVLIESNGKGGLWTEVGRIVSFGKLPSEIHEAHAIAVEAQALSARLSVPGANPAAISAEVNAFLVSRGGQGEKRLYSHGQGYDAVERPMIRSDETMPLPNHISIAIHPSFSIGPHFATLCDNYLVGEGGGFLHATPKKVFEL